MNEPFIKTVSPTIERANRLLSLRDNPGYPDAWQISKALSDDATRTSVMYPGWDPQQIMVLKARAQAALEHHELFFAKIQEAISDGIQEQSLQMNLAEKTPTEIIEQGDYVRQEVLTHFAELDVESRVPGSY
jgi:hypothetical protein